MLKGTVCQNGKPVYEDMALNDIVIGRRSGFKIIRFNVYVDGEFLSAYAADGIIVATPTGSTAYSLSAGGPIVEPGASLILLTPVCPHTLNTRSIVLRPEDEVVIEIGQKQSGQTQEAEANFDGSGLMVLRSRDRIQVTRSEKTTSVIKLSELSFLERLHRKMSE